MNKRFLSVLAFAFAISAAASLILYRLVASRMANEKKPVTTQLVAAARNLPVGTLIRDTDLRVSDWPGALPPNTIQKKEDIVGRGVIQTIYEGEPILETRLAPKGAGAGLAATIPQGMRAVAIRVNEVVGVAGFVTPGQRVDILVMGTPPGGTRANLGTLTRTLLQNIEVLSAGHQIEKDAEGKPQTVQVVNLLVTPEQAETLSLASNEARIQLVLRNPLDTQQANPPGTAMANLFTNMPLKLQKEEPARPAGPRVVRAKPAVAPVPVAQKAPPPPVVVEVIHGTRRAEAKFKEDAEVQR